MKISHNEKRQSYFGDFFKIPISSKIVLTKSLALYMWYSRYRGKKLVLLPFHFIQVLNGTKCQRNEDCDRGKMEGCQKHKDINLKICIRKIYLYFKTLNI